MTEVDKDEGGTRIAVPSLYKHLEDALRFIHLTQGLDLLLNELKINS